MPTIEVLPNSLASSSGANWAYTTLPPAHAVSGSLPVGTSGRGARTRNTNFENTAARQRQINTRISELEKDNYRDVQIIIPKRAAYRSKHTSTQNVRRILASQKTFVNHLSDEEALNPALQQRSRRASSEASDDGEAMDVDDATPATEVKVSGEEDGGPPLGYARAVSRPPRRPSRAFCEICGYWGNYRCGKCGARYCGMECGGVHLETRCNKFYG